MEQNQYNQLFSFIWNIATDVLVYAFDKGEYKKLMDFVRRVDPKAFVTVYSVSDMRYQPKK